MQKKSNPPPATLSPRPVRSARSWRHFLDWLAAREYPAPERSPERISWADLPTYHPREG